MEGQRLKAGRACREHIPWGRAQPYHGAVGEADDHLHREVVFLQVQLSQFAVELILSVALQGETKTTYLHSPEGAERHKGSSQERGREEPELLCSRNWYHSPRLLSHSLSGSLSHFSCRFSPQTIKSPHHRLTKPDPSLSQSLQLCD